MPHASTTPRPDSQRSSLPLAVDKLDPKDIDPDRPWEPPNPPPTDKDGPPDQGSRD